MKNLSFIACIILLTGCFTHYPKCEKTPCGEISGGNTCIKEIVGKRNIAITDHSLTYGNKRTFEYASITKLVVKTKQKLKGKNYTIVMHTPNGNFALSSYDKDLAIKVYSQLQCFIDKKNAAD